MENEREPDLNEKATCPDCERLFDCDDLVFLSEDNLHLCDGCFDTRKAIAIRRARRVGLGVVRCHIDKLMEEDTPDTVCTFDVVEALRDIEVALLLPPKFINLP